MLKRIALPPSIQASRTGLPLTRSPKEPLYHALLQNIPLCSPQFTLQPAASKEGKQVPISPNDSANGS